MDQGLQQTSFFLASIVARKPARFQAIPRAAGALPGVRCHNKKGGSRRLFLLDWFPSLWLRLARLARLARCVQRELFADARRLSGTLAEVVELGPTDVAAALDLDAGDQR